MGVEVEVVGVVGVQVGGGVGDGVGDRVGVVEGVAEGVGGGVVEGEGVAVGEGDGVQWVQARDNNRMTIPTTRASGFRFARNRSASAVFPLPRREGGLSNFQSLISNF